MKSNLLGIIRITACYVFLGVMLQVFIMNNIWASRLPENTKLQDVKIKMNGDTITLEQTFGLIERQTDFKFFYIKEEVPLNEKVKMYQEEESLYQILKGFAKEYSLAFNRIDNQIVVKKVENSQSETVKVQGTVRDASTNEPLTFASIVVEETQQETMTDANGRFTIILAQDTNHLRCSYVGYKTVRIEISQRKNLQIVITMSSLDVLLQSVTVYASQDDETIQEEVSTLTLQSETIKQSTSLMADVLRSVQMLPGVSNDNELSAKFDVHGGDANENLVLINGTQVYEPYHIKEAANISLGIFDVDMIKKMDLITGGFSARYGDRMSSVLNIDYREGSKDRRRGQASLSMTDFNGLLEGPIGENGSFIIGARQSYLQYVKNIVGVAQQIHPSFYDIQGVLAYQLAPQHKMSLKFIHAGDTFIQDPIMSGWNTYTPSYHDPSGLIGPLSISQNDSTEMHAQYHSSMIALQSVDVISSYILMKSEISYYDQRESAHSGELEPYASLFQSHSIYAFYRSVYSRLYDNDLRIQTLELSSSVEFQAASFFGIRTGANYQPIYYDRKFSDRRTYEEFTNDDYKSNRYPDTLHTLQDLNPIRSDLDTVHTHTYKLGGY